MAKGVNVNPCTPCNPCACLELPKPEPPCHKEKQPCHKERPCHKPEPCHKEKDCNEVCRKAKECKNRCKSDCDVSLLITITDAGATAGSTSILPGINEFPLGDPAALTGATPTTDPFVNSISGTACSYREAAQATQFDPLIGCIYVVPSIIASPVLAQYASLQASVQLYFGPSSTTAAAATGSGVSLYINNTGAVALPALLLGSTLAIKFVSNRGCQCAGQGCKAVCPISFLLSAPALLNPASTIVPIPQSLSAADVAALANSSRDPRCQKRFRVYSSPELLSGTHQPGAHHPRC